MGPHSIKSLHIIITNEEVSKVVYQKSDRKKNRNNCYIKKEIQHSPQQIKINCQKEYKSKI